MKYLAAKVTILKINGETRSLMGFLYLPPVSRKVSKDFATCQHWLKAIYVPFGLETRNNKKIQTSTLLSGVYYTRETKEVK